MNSRILPFSYLLLFVMVLNVAGCGAPPKSADINTVEFPGGEEGQRIAIAPKADDGKITSIRLSLRNQHFVYDLNSHGGAFINLEDLPESDTVVDRDMDDLESLAISMNPQALALVRLENKLFLTTLNGIFYWDGTKDSLLLIPDLPLRNIAGAKRVGEHKVKLNGKVLYDLQTDIWKLIPPASYSGSNPIAGIPNCQIYRSLGGVDFYNWSPSGNRNSRIFIPCKEGLVATNCFFSGGKISVEAPLIMQHQKRQFAVFNMESETYSQFPYYIPGGQAIGKTVFQDGLLWMIHSTYTYVLDTKTGDKYYKSYASTDEDRVARVEGDFVSIKSGNETLEEKKVDFLLRFPRFDENRYVQRVQHFKEDVDSLAMQKDSTNEQVLSKMNFLKQKYEGDEAIEIHLMLKDLRATAFRGVKLGSDEQYYETIEDTLIPIERRRQCLQAIYKRHWRSLNIDQVRACQEKYGSLPRGGILLQKEDATRLETYVSTIDSLNRSTTISADSAAFFRAMALYGYSQARPMMGEGCSGPNLLLMFDSLKHFSNSYSQSKLLDNAFIASRGVGLGHDFEMYVDTSEVHRLFQECRALYPDTDMEVDCELVIIIGRRSPYTSRTEASLTKEQLEKLLATNPPQRVQKRIHSLLKELDLFLLQWPSAS